VENQYASTFAEGHKSYAVLVKTREGRPIHVAGNDRHPGLRGKTSPRAVASVLGLYDPDRLKGPRIQQRAAGWDEALGDLKRAVAGAAQEGRGTLLLTGAVNSPTRKGLLSELSMALPGLQHLAWEPAAGQAALEARRLAFGEPVAFRPRLERSRVILSLGSEFLNGDDPEAIAAFSARRRPDGPGSGLNRLWVLEGPLSLTGAKADQRYPVRPSQLAGLAFTLARDLQERHDLRLPAGVSLGDLPGGLPAKAGIPASAWRHLALDLAQGGPEAVVLCGEAMPAEAQVAAHLLNAQLSSRGLEARPGEALASQGELEAALERMAQGRVAVAIFWGANPAYAQAQAGAWKAALAKVPTRAWVGQVEDETSAQCGLLLPEHHWLEAWGDYDDGAVLTLQQPAVAPLYDTRQGEEVLLALLQGLVPDNPAFQGDYLAHLKARWRREVQPPHSLVPFERYFQGALHDGLVGREVRFRAPAFRSEAVAGALHRALEAPQGSFELLLRPGTQVHDGRHAGNGWLQELPDPITKTTWGNPLSVSVADGERLGLDNGHMALLEVGGRTYALPVLLQPGQAPGVLALALGYGRATGTLGKDVGLNGYPMLDPDPLRANLASAALTKGRGQGLIASTQTHHALEGRDLAPLFTLAELARIRRSRRSEPATLYPRQAPAAQKWGMAIDLSACVGCSACMVACQSENNVPIVGPRQVALGREMHWIRVDSYHLGPPANPRVVHQPMLCQHCEDAPCENVCPVNATNHSPDGLNQMVYNRCVGTRYCANNCPYKVRRFNFRNYTFRKTEPESLQYNPEVTVRPGGVMEKCTFCVQRIQEARVRAQGERRPIRDGEIVPACEQACPASAITFGNLLDPASRVSRLSRNHRRHKVLEDLGTRPAITYLADLRNPAGEEG
jgi:molybdopterin-containing oxidoreductase family iron-sulfur binding subunit